MYHEFNILPRSLHNIDLVPRVTRGIHPRHSSHSFEAATGQSRLSSICVSISRRACKASENLGSPGLPAHASLDSNQLQTALNNAIKSEDYTLAASLRNALRESIGENGNFSLDWRSFGCPHWLAERAEQMGYQFPTDIQRRCCSALQRGGHDVVIQSETGSGKTLAFVMPLLSILDYPPALFPEDLLGPQLLILVPSMELGVQEAMLIYKLFGGSVNPGIPGASANMFAYTGPRGLKVRGLLTDQEVLMSKTIGYLKGAHVVIATPDNLAEVHKFPEFRGLFNDLKAVAIDEVDACFKEHSKTMESLLAEATAIPEHPKPLVALIGATQDDSLATQCSQMGWLIDPIVISSNKLSDGEGRIPKGLLHRYIIADQSRKLAVLCRHLRADLEQQGDDAPPPRVIVFTDSEEAAVAAATPLRNALWGQHKLAVLLPHGDEPIKAMHDFRDNAATFLLATPSASRGLDLPAVSHVYNLSCPDVTTYLHQAGRTGRIGSPVQGIVTTILAHDEVERFCRMAKTLGLEVEEVQALPGTTLSDPDADIDGTRNELEDLYNLL